MNEYCCAAAAAAPAALLYFIIIHILDVHRTPVVPTTAIYDTYIFFALLLFGILN